MDFSNFWFLVCIWESVNTLAQFRKISKHKLYISFRYKMMAALRPVKTCGHKALKQPPEDVIPSLDHQSRSWRVIETTVIDLAL